MLARVRPRLVWSRHGGWRGTSAGREGPWVQFHGVAAKNAAATVIINYHGKLTNLGTLPYAFVNPASSVLLHTHRTGVIANNYPQPLPEYLAYLGIPMIILLLVAIVYFWRQLPIRVAGLTCLLLEWLGMGAKPFQPGQVSLPSFLLPWHFLEDLPVMTAIRSFCQPTYSAYCWRFGLNAVAYLSPDRYGLISMSGVVVPPRANKPWREKPHAAGERRR